MTLYRFFSDPLWQSIGVLLSTAGVFFGAWLGALLGYRQTIKLQKQQSKESKVAFELLFVNELSYNVDIIIRMRKYIQKNPPIVSALDSLEVGAKSLQVNVLDQMVSNNLILLLQKEQYTKMLHATNRIKRLSMYIQMEVNEWKRALEFNRFFMENKHDLMQIVNPQHILDQKMKTFEEEVVATIEVIEIAFQSFPDNKKNSEKE